MSQRSSVANSRCGHKPGGESGTRLLPESLRPPIDGICNQGTLGDKFVSDGQFWPCHRRSEAVRTDESEWGDWEREVALHGDRSCMTDSETSSFRVKAQNGSSFQTRRKSLDVILRRRSLGLLYITGFRPNGRTVQHSRFTLELHSPPPPYEELTKPGLHYTLRHAV